MRVVLRSQIKRFKNSPVCIAYEYPLGDKDINGAVIELKGRYPDKGRVVNFRCKELVYVLDGSIFLEVEGKKIKLKKGDEVLIMPKEKYSWSGNCKIFTACTPAWYPEQHKEAK